MVELARSTRSGVVESRHDGEAVAITADGEVIAVWGDPSQRVYYRSAIKPFQAIVSQRNGAALAPEQMALACASHGALPVHLAIVHSMLTEAGLSKADLKTPSAPPAATRSAMAPDVVDRRPLFHMCSGKHSAFLRACAASGYPTASYRDPEHPLQKQVMELVAEVTGEDAEPIGVDGCSAPAPSGTVLGLARAFARLTAEPSLADACSAMARFPALVSSNLESDCRIASWWGGPVKGGAKGLIGAGRNGIGIAVKSREGSSAVAAVGLVAMLRHIGLLSDAAHEALGGIAEPAVFGGGARVGSLEPAFDG